MESFYLTPRRLTLGAVHKLGLQEVGVGGQKKKTNLVNVVCERPLKYSQLISSSDNKKILLTTRNVGLDSGRYATKYYYLKES